MEDEWATLLDISNLYQIPKNVRPLEKQIPTESRKLWDGVTTRMLSKEFGEATKQKQVIEQKQRDDSAERKRAGIEWVFRSFIYGFHAYVASVDSYPDFSGRTSSRGYQN